MRKEHLDISTLESWLWEAACVIHGPVDAPKYKDYILPLIFLKRLSDVFADEIRMLGEEMGDESVARDLVEADHNLVRFYIAPEARWSHIAKLPQPGLGEALTDAVRSISRENPKLAGVIDITDFNATTAGQRIIADSSLHHLVQILNKHRVGLDDVEPDFLGRAYEYLIRKFAEGSGSSAGEFYTPRMVGVLMAKIMSPDPGMTVYDPACGSGGLLIKCQLELIERYGEQKNSHKELPSTTAPLKIYGQEILPTAYAMANMNCFIHDMDADIALGDTMVSPRFTQHNGSLCRFDIVTANPMWNQSTFSDELYSNDSFNRFTKGIPPNSTADWGWVQHIFASLNPNGRAAVILDTGSLFRGSRDNRGNIERDIRRAFILEDVIEAVILLPPNLFYNTDAHGIILILNKNKDNSKKNKILMINASDKFIKGRPKNFLSENHVNQIVSAYHSFADEKYFSRIIEKGAISMADDILLPSWFIQIYDEKQNEVDYSELEKIPHLHKQTKIKIEMLELITMQDLEIIPEEWKFRKLGDFVKEYSEKAGDREFPVFSCSKIDGIILQSERFNHQLASKNLSNYKVIYPNMFGFDPMLLWDGSIGKNNYDFPGVISPAYKVFEVISEDISSEFLELILNAPSMRPQYTSISLGTNVRRRKVTFTDFEEILIPVPRKCDRNQIIKLIGNLHDSIKAQETIINIIKDAWYSNIGQKLSEYNSNFFSD